MTVIDSHHHFRRVTAHPQSWAAAVGDRLERDFTEDDLRPELVRCGIDQTILVQLLNNVDETADYLAPGRKADYVAGVVGWVPLNDPVRCAVELDRLSAMG